MLAETSPLDRWRCLLLVGAPGYGKTTALRSWLPAASCRRFAFAAIQQLGAGELPDHDHPDTDQHRWLVVDDVPALSADEANNLLAWVDSLPETIGVALASRWPPGAPISRGLGRGWLRQVLAADLALAVDQVAALLRDDYELRDPALPAQLHAATGGWPALVRLAAETLVRQSARADAPAGDALVDCLAAPGTAVAAYIADEVLAALPPAAARLVRDVAGFAPLSVELCTALGHRGASRTMDMLARTGLIEAIDSGGRYRVVPVVAAVARRARRTARARALARTAADWFTEHGPPIAAARALHEAGDEAGCARLLADFGEEMLAAGETAGFIELAALLPERLRSQRVRVLWGDALRAAGDAAAAMAIFSELAAAAGSRPLDPALAWRMGMVHYLKAEPRAALELYARAGAGSVRDEIFLAAWTATAHWMMGDVIATTAQAEKALERAVSAGDDGALAAAHIAMAMARKLAGNPAAADEHYGHALRVARRAGDLVQVTRILVNQSHELLARAEYRQALQVAGNAARVAQASGPAGMLIIAVCNEAEALGRTGNLDEAIDRYRRVLPMCQRMGSRRTATVLAGLADVHRRRGWREQARAAYEEAVRIARVSREAQALVPALAGLARILAKDDPVLASELAEEAAGSAQGKFGIDVQVAQGWVCLARGERSAALDLAERAAKEARYHRLPGWIAETLELRAAAEDDPAAVRAALAEARTIWGGAGAVIDSDRVLATLDAVPDARTEDRLAAMLARGRQAAAGIQAEAVAVPLAFGPAGDSWVHIQVLGRFEVRVRNRPVPASAWQSRKARDLLRILVARRARVVPRDELAELLWPEDDPTRTGHRLSVLLSLVRSVLDPDRSAAADQYIVADKTGIALDPSRIRIDVEEFLADITHGSRLYDQGALAQARSVLTAAERSYVGDPFGDDPYADWTAPLREQARAAHQRAHRTLARLARRSGDTDEALCHLLAILERDPYDEDAHRTIVATLVAAGRHGEARRAHDRYVEAMRSIGLPDPGGTPEPRSMIGVA
jgi:DNA-binding SARP family transcriptional activator